MLREKLGDDGCTALVEVMNHVTEMSRADVVELCTQRFERRLAEEQVKTRAAIDALRVDLSAVEVRILRWMVTLFIVQGVFALVLKHLL